ncbi:MAG: ABC-2 type transport system permease protein [Paracoccaceae bacterium]
MKAEARSSENSKGRLPWNPLPPPAALNRFLQARELTRFELLTQLRHPAFWLSVAACAAAGVAFGATDLGALSAAPGRLARNVPVGVVTGLSGLSSVGMIIALVLVGTAGLRDSASGMTPLILSKPVSRLSLLAGRYAGAVLAVLAAMSVGALAMAATYAAHSGSDPAITAGTAWPWVVGMVLFVVPNVLFISSFVLLAALSTHRISTTFLAVLPVIVGQDIAEALASTHPDSWLPALMDPIGFAALQAVTRGWTVAEFQHDLPALTGPLLANRLLWLAITPALLALCLRVLSRHPRADRSPSSKDEADGATASPTLLGATAASPAPLRVTVGFQGPRTSIHQGLAIARLELLRFGRSLVFVTLFLTGASVLIYSLIDGERVLGVAGLPGSRGIALGMERAAKLSMTLLVVLFTGELVWRERVSGMAATLDAYPASRLVVAAGKIAALSALLLVTVAGFGLLAWLVQWNLSGAAAPPGHVLGLIGHHFLTALQLASVALLLQILAGGPMLGFLLVGVVLVGRIALRASGWSGSLYSLQGLKLPDLGALEGYGRGLERALLGHAYWCALAILLLGAAVWLWPRGVASGPRERWTQARRRSTAMGVGTALIGMLAVGALGAQLYRTTEAPGAGWTRQQFREARARYERDYGHLRNAEVPRVESIRGVVDLETASGTLDVQGQYRLVHRGSAPVSEMLISFEPDLELMTLERRDDWKERHDAAGSMGPLGALSGHAGTSPGTWHLVFDPPLAVGETTYLAFALRLAPGGWGRRPTERWLRRNGSFLLGGTGTHEFFQGAQIFPKLGYDAARELRSTRDRQRHGLPPWSPALTPEAFTEGASQVPQPEDRADVDLWIHAASDEVALGPGDLLERTVADGRSRHHYVCKEAIPAMFPIVCGRYEVSLGRAGDVELEVYHAPGHGARVPHILWAIQRSLAYFEAQWGPYPHRVLRVAEVPGGATFACSFPTLMAFAEGMAFTQPKGDGGPIPWDGHEAAHAVDPLLWLVAHEVAHQWWNGQVVAAPALGAELISESLAQYGAVGVIDQEYGADVVLATALHHRDRYLDGRSRSDRGERPLVQVDEQDHLHYGKGFLAFYSLARAFGREPIDRALRSLMEEHGGPDGAPLLSPELMEALARELPESTAPILKSLFERIEFHEVAVDSATVRELGDQRYLLVVDGAARSVEANEQGAESVIPFAVPLEMSVSFGGVDPSAGDQPGGDSQLFTIQPEDERFHLEVELDRAPVHIVLDPRLLLIERDLTDNEAPVREERP